MIAYAEIYDDPLPTVVRKIERKPLPLHFDGIHFIIIYIFALFFMALTINK